MAEKKGGPRRKKAQREKDLTLIAEWYCRGETQEWMAVELARLRKSIGYRVSRQTISRDLKEIRSRWLESSVRDFDEAKAEELAKIDHLEREAWAEYLRSKEVQKKSVHKTVQGDKSLHEAKLEELNRVGDVRFLQVVERCIDRRCKLLGLDAPVKTDITSGGQPLNIVEVAYTTEGIEDSAE
jgi:hypothetical protein